MEWMDISTAPKDGTKFAAAAFCDVTGEWLMWQDYWRKYLLKGEGLGVPKGGISATHWMPLPSLPENSDADAMHDAWTSDMHLVGPENNDG